MPLTHHLRPGAELGDWLRAESGDTLWPYAGRLASAAARNQPLRPAQRQELPHYAAVGSIVDARLALAVQHAPPYAAVTGALALGVLDVPTADQLVSTWPSHQDIAPVGAAVTRPTPRGPWRIAEPAQHPDATASPLVTETFRLLRRLAVALPLGQLGGREAEAELAGVLATAQSFEQVYREGTVPETLRAFLTRGAVEHAPELLADAVRVITAQTGPLTYAHRLAPGAAGYAAPVFVPAWAEGDLLLGPAGQAAEGSTLVEVKTVTRVDPQRALDWLLQLLAYVLLDHAGHWQISRIAVWLPRRGVLLDCPLAELTRLLSRLRRGLLTRAARAIEADGGDADALLWSQTRHMNGGDSAL